MRDKVRLGILLSGRGSNFQAIAQAIREGVLKNAEIAVVIANRPSAPGVLAAEEDGYETVVVERKRFPHREAYDQAIADQLRDHTVDLVVLAGYDQILSRTLLQAYRDRILNIHPSLLPAYGGRGMVGLKVHEAVIRAGETQSGCTIHWVTEDVDAGPIVGQRVVAVLPGDSPEALAERVLEQEHQLYAEVIQQVSASLLAEHNVSAEAQTGIMSS